MLTTAALEGAREAWVDLSGLAFASYEKGYEPHGKDESIVFLYEFGRLAKFEMEITDLHKAMNDDAKISMIVSIHEKQKKILKDKYLPARQICERAGFKRREGRCFGEFSMLKLFCVDASHWNGAEKYSGFPAYCSKAYDSFASKNEVYLRKRFEIMMRKFF